MRWRPLLGGQWRRGSLVAGSVGMVAVFTAGGCIEPNFDHCAFGYGDRSCPADRGLCVLAIEKTSHEGIVDGCTAQMPSTGFVRVPYGLPDRVAAPIDDSRAPRSIQGVLTEYGYPVECVGSLALEQHFNAARIASVRQRLEEQGHTRRSRLDLNEFHQEAIADFSDDVRIWIEQCTERFPAGGSSTGESTGTVEGSSTTEELAPCIVDADCTSSPDAPFCDPATETCVACDALPDPDAACAEVASTVPLCVDGACVACTADDTAACDAQLLICDSETMQCVPCTEHDECTSGACDLMLDVPTCFEADSVLDVGTGQNFSQINDAITEIDAMMLDRAVLRLHGSGLEFNESATVSTGAIAFIAADRDTPRWGNSFGMAPPTLSIVGRGTRVYLDRLELSFNPANPGLSCEGGSVDIRRSRIVMNYGGGITASIGCEIHVRNSFVGGDDTDTDAISVENSTLDMLYTTVIAGYGASAALSCGAASFVSVRNSIMVSPNFVDVECPIATMESNATNSNARGSNVPVGGWKNSWFADYSYGDFSLGPIGIEDFANIAAWQSGDPSTDIHGDPRPDSDGASDYPGADVP